MSQFTVSGRFQTRHGAQEFTKSVDAPNESVAREYVLSQLGSEHNLKRARIDLGEVTAA
jgi:large subunit ribosomal protein LX